MELPLLWEDKTTRSCQVLLLSSLHCLRKPFNPAVFLKAMSPNRNHLSAIFCLLGALYFGYQYFQDKNEADISAKWQSVTAVVDSSNFTTSYSRHSHSYNPHVQYHFNAGGTTHNSSRISFPDPSFGKQSEAEELIAKYPKNSLTTAYFDPKNPDEACLITGEGAALGKEGLIAVVLGIASAILCVIPSANYRRGGMYKSPTSMITPSR